MPIDARRALDAQATQHRVDEPLVRQVAPAMGHVDAGRDRRVRWGAQKQKLGDTEPQYVVHGRRPRRQRHVETIGDQRIDLAEAPQHCRHQQARERTIAARQFAHRRIVFDRVVERPLAAEHRTDQVERNVPRVWRLGHQGSYIKH